MMWSRAVGVRGGVGGRVANTEEGVDETEAGCVKHVKLRRRGRRDGAQGLR